MKYITSLLLILSFCISFASGDKDKGDMYYSKGLYLEANVQYLKIKEPNLQELELIGNCYYYMHSYDNALKYYSKIIDNSTIDPIIHYRYARMQEAKGEYLLAQSQLAKFKERDTTKLDVSAMEESCKWALRQNKNKENYKLVKTNLNVGGVSLGAFPFEKGIIYSKPQTSVNGKQTIFYNLTYAKAINDSVFEEAVDMGLDNKFYEGISCVSKDGNTIYFTLNKSTKDKFKAKKSQKDKLSEKGVNGLKICSATKTEGVWSNIKDLSFNDLEYSCAHPTLSEDGKTMYFVSNREGGQGDYDIYKSELLDGKWSAPINLGPTINTPFKEAFPSFYKNQLYFSSKGHKGFGGFDVFVTNLKETVTNMGYGMNSAKDDFGVAWTTKTTGYISSNREGNNGNDSIYFFQKNIFKESVKIVVLDSVHSSPVLARVVATTSSGIIELDLMTNEDGSINLDLDLEKEYKINISAPGYIEKVVELPKGKREDLIVKLSPDILKAVLVNKISFKPIPNVYVAISDGKNDTIYRKTSEDGYFYFPFSPNDSYVVAANLKTYDKFVEALPIEKSRDNLRFEMSPEIKKNAVINLDNIYFGYDKAMYLAESTAILERLLEFMKETPKMRIELSAHTDSRGSDSYNLKLSKRRAESCTKFLVDNGILPSRIRTKGYGETKPLNRCTNGVKCTDDEFQINRRVEVKIL